MRVVAAFLNELVEQTHWPGPSHGSRAEQETYDPLVSSPPLTIPWTPKPGHWSWVTSAKVGAVRAETLWCGEIPVADIWIIQGELRWEVRGSEQLGLEPDAGTWDPPPVLGHYGVSLQSCKLWLNARVRAQS